MNNFFKETEEECINNKSNASEQQYLLPIEGPILCKEFRYFYAGDIYYLIEAKLCANNKFYILYPEKDNYITNISNGNMCKLEIILNHKEFTQLLKVED